VVGRRGITVNAVAPGWIVTEMARAGGSEEEFQARVRSMSERTMVGRTGRPNDIANAVAFLASPESGFVTAQVITVDGGRMDYIGHGGRAAVRVLHIETRRVRRAARGRRMCRPRGSAGEGAVEDVCNSTWSILAASSESGSSTARLTIRTRLAERRHASDHQAVARRADVVSVGPAC
jgi:hypothetical protein